MHGITWAELPKVIFSKNSKSDIFEKYCPKYMVWKNFEIQALFVTASPPAS